MRWLLDHERGIAVAQPCGVMGIINATPDSFSDGGRNLDAAAAVRSGLEMVAAGADWLDVGGESTRPGSDPVDAGCEIARVVPVIAALRSAGVRIPISIDTAKGAVAEAALAAGADAVNDVSGGADPRLLAACAATRCVLAIMHMRGTPSDMQRDPRYGDVVAEVASSLSAGVDAAVRAGIRAEALVVDPGIGFGKTAGHNLALLRALPAIRAATGRPVMVGVSRKTVIAAVGGLAAAPGPGRDGAGHAVHALIARDCCLVRVHDVAGARAALRLAAALHEAA